MNTHLSSSAPRPWHTPAIVILLLVAVALAYYPGLHGPFILDDTENITLNPGAALQTLDATSLRRAALSNDSGPLGRPLAALSFGINHYLAGGFDDTFPFKLTNLLIHGINGVLVFFLALRLMRISWPGATLSDTRRRQIAALAAGLWALHPIQLTNVLYVVQRMNSLSALFVLLGLLLFLRGRACLETHPRRGLWLMSLGVLGGMALGALAKENALLLPLLALTIEYTLIQDPARASPLRRTLSRFHAAMMAIPLLAGVFLLLWHPESILGGYVARPFTPLERLLTEARVLWHYLGLLLLPLNSRLGLFHDDIALSTGLFTPLSTLPAVAGLCLALFFALARARHYPVLAFGVLWYLAGHSLESGLLGLEIAFEHRNYLPALGVFLPLSYGAVRLVTQPESRLKRYLPALAGVLLLAIGAATWVRAGTWSDMHTLAAAEARHHPRSARANDLAARLSLGSNDVAGAVHYTLAGLQAAPREAGFHIELRILLTHLALGIDAMAQKEFPSAVSDGARIAVRGLPPEITASTAEGSLRLDYPASTDDVIARLLKEQPVTVHTVVALENLTHCLLDGQRACQALQPLASRWLGLALENPRSGKIQRGILAANAARIHARENDLRRALEYMQRAAELVPQHLPYRLAQIDYLLLLGEPARASTMLDQARQTWPRNDIQWARNRALIESITSRLAGGDG